MMRVARILLLASCIFATTAFAQGGVRFATVDIFLTSSEPFAAWQFEIRDRNDGMQVVGVENGASRAYAGTPYYDRNATEAGTVERLVVADYTLAATAELPRGRVRIATVHLMLDGNSEPDLQLELVTATTGDGHVVNATLDLAFRQGQRQ